MSQALYWKLRLKAERTEDLKIFSTLLQDAVLKVEDMGFQPKRRRFALLANRFRWEGELQGKARAKIAPQGERVRTALRFEGVLQAQSRNIPFEIKKQVLELLSLEAKKEPAGFRVTLTFAGGAAVALQAEVIEAYLEDLTAPWPAKRRPAHEGA
ncbi:MAG TPA: DUF2948 family protein [Sphingomonadales bacterium]|nr:DUF2948 family protein [Sphingomonadales bacterium]